MLMEIEKIINSIRKQEQLSDKDMIAILEKILEVEERLRVVEAEQKSAATQRMYLHH